MDPDALNTVSLMLSATAVLVSVSMIVVFALRFFQEKRNAELGKALTLTLKEQNKGSITDDDVEKIMKNVSLAEYVTSPEDRRLIAQELLAATAHQRPHHR